MSTPAPTPSDTPDASTDTNNDNDDGGGGREYSLGPVHGNTKSCATFSTKPTTQLTDRRVDTGGGYERWRSTEYRPSSSVGRKEDVYVPVHRLSAVAWCYPEDMEVGEILQHLDGRDVHHTVGVEWANFGESPNFDEPGLQVCDHGRHSEVTQAQMRAWAEDAKESAREGAGQMVAGGGTAGERCAECGDSEGVLATTENLEDNYCLGCVRERADGDTIEVL